MEGRVQWIKDSSDEVGDGASLSSLVLACWSFSQVQEICKCVSHEALFLLGRIYVNASPSPPLVYLRFYRLWASL